MSCAQYYTGSPTLDTSFCQCWCSLTSWGITALIGMRLSECAGIVNMNLCSKFSMGKKNALLRVLILDIIAIGVPRMWDIYSPQRSEGLWGWPRYPGCSKRIHLYYILYKNDAEKTEYQMITFKFKLPISLPSACLLFLTPPLAWSCRLPLIQRQEMDNIMHRQSGG